MFFQRIKTPGIAHAAYLLGNQGEAAIVDPRRDIAAYLRIAAENDLTIRYVVETHRQEDFVLGSSELARVTGARVVNGQHELFGRGDIRLADGEELSVGGIRLRALHTPGHTPESMCYAMFLPDAPDLAWGVLSGDTLFIGDTGRTDLPDPKKTRENAGLLYDAVHEKLLPLGDQTLIFPAHASGSVCGGNIADRDDSTLGLERRYNPVFTHSRSAFMEAKRVERLPRPPYFATMEELNLKGGIPLARRPEEIRVLPPQPFAEESGSGLVIDAREPEAFAGGHTPGALSVWSGGLSVFGGWVATPATRVYLVLAGAAQLDEAVLALARIGLDRVEGMLAGGFAAWRNAGLPIERSGAITPRDLRDNLGSMRVLDVREDSEFEEGHIPKSTHVYVGYLEGQLDRIQPPLDRSQPIAVTCSVGHRASLAVSVLRRRGFTQVDNLLGGMTAWKKLELPESKDKEHSIATEHVEGART